MWFSHKPTGKICKVVYENEEGFIIHIKAPFGWSYIPYEWDDKELAGRGKRLTKETHLPQTLEQAQEILHAEKD